MMNSQEVIDNDIEYGRGGRWQTHHHLKGGIMKKLLIDNDIEYGRGGRWQTHHHL